MVNPLTPRGWRTVAAVVLAALLASAGAAWLGWKIAGHRSGQVETVTDDANARQLETKGATTVTTKTNAAQTEMNKARDAANDLNIQAATQPAVPLDTSARARIAVGDASLCAHRKLPGCPAAR